MFNNVKQPKNTTEGRLTLQWNSKFSDFRGKQFDASQKSIDSDVLRLCWPLVPFDKGDLNRSAIFNTIIGSGLVKYATPYARRLYYNPGFLFQGGPVRGAYWFERMKDKDLPEIKRNAGREFT